MALRFSTKLRNLLNSRCPVLDTTIQISAITIAAVDGGAGNDSFTDSANGFVTAGFKVGDSVLIMGFAGAGVGNNGKIVELLSVAAGTIEIATGTLAAEVAGATVVLTRVAGGSLRDIIRAGVLKIYSGTQPASADAAYTGSLLATITKASGAFTPGAPTNGLSFGLSASGVIAKDSDVWSAVIAADGIAGWFRFYANASDAGGLDSGLIYPRIDGAIATSGAQLNFSSTSLTTGATLTIDTFSITLPAE